MNKKDIYKKHESPIDYKSALERTGEDESFLNELLDLYREDFPEKQNKLQEAIKQNNFNSIQNLGHSIKGSSANLSLIFLQEASFQIESAGRKKDIEEAKKAFELLKHEFKRLKDFLRAQA